MILLDERTGSKELLKYFKEGEAELAHLDFADACFLGNGPEGETWSIGIERKTVHDLISSITTGRLSGHQLIGLMDSYQVVYLIVEGLWRAGPKNGAVQTYRGKGWNDISFGRRRFTAASLVGYLNTLDQVCGVSVRGTSSPRETAFHIRALRSWWSREWEDHKAHKQYHKTKTPRGDVNEKGKRSRSVSLVPPSLLRRMAAELKGIGWGKSCRVADHFDSVTSMVTAPEDEWLKIEGIGKKLANQIVESLR